MATELDKLALVLRELSMGDGSGCIRIPIEKPSFWQEEYQIYWSGREPDYVKKEYFARTNNTWSARLPGFKDLLPDSPFWAAEQKRRKNIAEWEKIKAKYRIKMTQLMSKY